MRRNSFWSKQRCLSEEKVKFCKCIKTVNLVIKMFLCYSHVLCIFYLHLYLIKIHIFDYPDSRLSGLFTEVPMSPDNRGLTVIINWGLNHFMLFHTYLNWIKLIFAAGFIKTGRKTETEGKVNYFHILQHFFAYIRGALLETINEIPLYVYSRPKHTLKSRHVTTAIVVLMILKRILKFWNHMHVLSKFIRWKGLKFFSM